MLPVILPRKGKLFGPLSWFRQLVDVQWFQERLDKTEVVMRMRRNEPIKNLEQGAADS